MANEGSTKPTYSELEAELLRVRGLLQRIRELPRYEHTCEYGIHCIEKKPLGSYLVRNDVLELVSQSAESADIGKLDSADKDENVLCAFCPTRSPDHSMKACLEAGKCLYPDKPVGHFAFRGSAETGGEKAAPYRIDLLAKMYNIAEFLRDDTEFRLKERLLKIRKVLCELEPKLNWLDTNFPRTSQNQTVSGGVEGAHEGITADKSELLPTQLPKDK